GWWATWPAEKINGVMVSDRLYYTLTQGLTKAVLREDLPDTIYPVQRTQEFIDLRDRAVLETDWRSVRYFMPVSAADFEAAVAADRGMEDPIDGFRRLLASTKTYLGAGLIVGENQPDLALVYLEGTDTIGHLLAPYMPPPTLEVDPAKADVFRAAVPKYFEIVDRWIGRYLERYPLSEYALLMVSDHGFKWAEGRPRGLSGTAGPTAPLWHDMDAVFLLAGRGVRSLGRVELEASVYDVAPTVLALLGLPADTSWDGTVLPGSPPASVEPIDYRPLLPPESYTQTGGGPTPLDPEFIAKLKSLGYLGRGARPTQDTTGESSRSKNRDGPEPSGAAANSTGATRGQLNNLASIKLGEKKYEVAERILRQAIVQSPNYPSPHYNLRRMYMETESYDEADRELWLAVGKGLRDTERTIDRAAADYENLGLQERAAGLLSDAIERYPEHEPFWVHLIVVNIRLGKCAEGERLGAQAVIKFPQSAPAHAFYGLAAACDSDLSRARVELERSLELNPDQETLRRTLAELANQIE
ncbi:MAG: alkaline phosphatase family protein, partial [Thermoanaerobaculia bacterium]